MRKIDYEKMRKEIEKSMEQLKKQLNSKEFRESMQKLKDVDMNKLKEEINKVKMETDKSREELKKELQKMKEERDSKNSATAVFGFGVESNWIYLHLMINVFQKSKSVLCNFIIAHSNSFNKR